MIMVLIAMIVFSAEFVHKIDEEWGQQKVIEWEFVLSVIKTNETQYMLLEIL